LVTVWISANGLPTTIAWIKVAAAAPGILLYGNNHAVAQNQDFSLNQATVPAAPASFLTVYLTGIGPLDNPVGNGQPALADPLSRATQPYSATIGNVPATVSFLGLTPGFVGLAQANIQVPNLANGDYPLVLRVGGQASNAATVSIGK
jgi:adhesin/invasin